MKTAMVWGASGGIGQAITNLLNQEGWQVLAISRHPAGTETYEITAEFDDSASVQSAVMEAAMEVDAVNLFIYAAGDIQVSPVREADPASWSRQLNANLTGAFLTTHHSLPLLTADAHLFYLGAVTERLQLPGFAPYVAAKAGLEAFAAALAKEERKRRITVVRPGAVNTPFWEKVPMRLPKDAASPEKVARRILDAFVDGHTGQLDLV
jgi:NAD(P)-dependent dehydrogenase (short-subunit alcohol dehydrogenase family)